MHPDPGNQVWILRNMARNRSKTNFKVSPRVRNSGQISPWLIEATVIVSSCCRFNTYINQDMREHKLNTPPDTCSNWGKYSDLTGKFIVLSDRGNKYILVVYHYDANNILRTPLNNRTVPFILNGIKNDQWKIEKLGINTKDTHHG